MSRTCRSHVWVLQIRRQVVRTFRLYCFWQSSDRFFPRWIAPLVRLRLIYFSCLRLWNIRTQMSDYRDCYLIEMFMDTTILGETKAECVSWTCRRITKWHELVSFLVIHLYVPMYIIQIVFIVTSILDFITSFFSCTFFYCKIALGLFTLN